MMTKCLSQNGLYSLNNCPEPFSKSFQQQKDNNPAAKVHLNSTFVPRCFPKLVLCVVLPLAGWDDVNL